MVQQALPLAFVRGEAVIDKPEDLFIPPDALEIFLEAFEGPLDFLLYLIKKQKFNIVDLPIQEITLQYMEYVDLMREMKLELAAEYLVMAAMLAEIKSRLLLPRNNVEDDDEEDPRAELIRRLQEYEIFKQAAADLDNLPRIERDTFLPHIDIPDTVQPEVIHPDVDFQELVVAFQVILKRAKAFTHHEITPEVLSTRERMSQLLERLAQTKDFVPFQTLFDVTEGKSGVVVTFLAVLELVKETLIEVIQTAAYGQIHVRSKPAEVE
ncbi:MAG: segregation/condensation protein A [Gammaproteobacteria bacterium]|nr:segregation/condensation protein A [Gammaproteobacteria bacterium]